MGRTDRKETHRLTITNEATGDTTDRKVSSACAVRALELISRDHAGLPSVWGPVLEQLMVSLEARARCAERRSREVPDGEAERDRLLAASRARIAAGVLRDMALADSPEAWAAAHAGAEAQR